MMSKAQMVTLIPIRNMNRALRFYTKVMGGKLVYRGRGKFRNYWASLTVGGVPVWFVNPDEREKRSLAYQTFLVKNIRAEVAGLQRAGVKFQRAERGGPDTRVEGPILIEPQGSVAFFKDTEGNLLMLFEDRM